MLRKLDFAVGPTDDWLTCKRIAIQRPSQLSLRLKSGQGYSRQWCRVGSRALKSQKRLTRLHQLLRLLPTSESEVSLPGDEPAVNAPIGDGGASSRGLARRRVLVVDDTRAAAFMLGRLLETLGQDVSVCYDAETGMRVALDQQPEIIFSDIAMPHIDGYQFARLLRADVVFQHVKLVALTGFNGENERQLAHDAGFDHHIVKPVSLQALRGLLE